MENPLPLKLIEEQELFEKLLELLVLSTHSPKGRFSKDNSYIIFKELEDEFFTFKIFNRS